MNIEKCLACKNLKYNTSELKNSKTIFCNLNLKEDIFWLDKVKNADSLLGILKKKSCNPCKVHSWRVNEKFNVSVECPYYLENLLELT